MSQDPLHGNHHRCRSLPAYTLRMRALDTRRCPAPHKPGRPWAHGPGLACPRLSTRHGSTAERTRVKKPPSRIPQHYRLGQNERTQTEWSSSLEKLDIRDIFNVCLMRTSLRMTLIKEITYLPSMHQIKQAVRKLCNTDVVKVNNPDGQEEACVQLAPDDEALDVASKTGINSTDSSC
ncbi:60S ribosomal protein L23a-like [Orycteropus afer afer]|uniref:60S ribosomal protein L23a-like n=1 Tax=Orycteropus afer afer TaxID=1230840 RepID=A0A8B7A002_ORYAF|nr:60S ribosomal protein L23a-like [Orycteropus afer afer]